MKIGLNCLNRIFQIRYFKVPQLPIKGYTSRCEDGKHVLFLDYDMVNPEIVYTDIENLNYKFNISHAIVFATYQNTDELGGLVGNYHIICLEKFYFNEILEMMSCTHCDTYHKDLAKFTRYRSWVLRFSKKGRRPEPELVRIIEFNKKPVRESSKAHYKLLKLLNKEFNNLENINYKFDDSNNVVITTYNTGVEKK